MLEITLDLTEPNQNLPAPTNDREPILPNQAVHREGVEIPQGRGGFLDVEEVSRPHPPFVDLAADQALDRAALLGTRGIVPPEHDRPARLLAATR